MKQSIFLLGLSALFVAVYSFESSDDKEVKKFLGTFFDFSKGDSLKDGVKNIQKMAGLAPTGEVDKELLAHLGKSRCGGKDSKKQSKRYNPSGQKWESGKTYLFYIHNERSPNTMSRKQIERAIQVGMGYWSTDGNIYFRPAKNTKEARFSLSFVGGEHVKYDVHNNFKSSRDPYPLDNVPGNVLAHAFFPKDGNLHFDDAEKWTEGTDDGINLRIVTAHEGGHALGLFHSNDPKALMAPWYGGYTSEREYKLPSDDTQGIVSIYGTRRGRSLPRQVREAASEVKQKLCAAKNIKTAFELKDGNTYVVSETNEVFRLVNNKVDDSFKPVALPAALQDIDSIFFDRAANRLVYFKGDDIFAATGESIADFKSTKLEIKSKGAFDGHVSASFGRGVNSKKRSQFWAIQDGELIGGRIMKDGVRFGRRARKLSEVFDSEDTAMPPSIDGAIVIGKKADHRLIIFTGNSFYLGIPTASKPRKYKLASGYPKSFKSVIGC